MLKSNGKPVKYLDYSASVEPNPSSIHSLGVAARHRLESGREEAAQVLAARPEEIIFTSGGTESNNLAVQGIVYALQDKFKKPHLITTNIEHPSVLETFRMLADRQLAEISIVPVEKNGIIDPKKIINEIKKNTVLVSVMYANNEIGTVQPLREISKGIRHFRKINGTSLPYFHTDAVQGVNFLPLNVQKLGVDMLSLSGAKVKDSGRVGLLWKKKTVPLLSIMGGGDQEMGFRPGTENTGAIVKFASALKQAQKEKDQEGKRLQKLRDYFIEKIVKLPVILNGDLKNRLPNNINITFPEIPSDLLVLELSERGIMASAKSACKSSQSEGSYVIRALRPLADPEIGGIRFSLGAGTTKKDIDYTVKALHMILTKLKKWYT